MATKENTNVYLEAVEVAEDKSGEPKEIGDAQLDGIPKRKHS